MSYHMQRADREIKDPATLNEILKNCNYAVLALCNNNEPYAVTLSYGFAEEDKTLYFHGAKNDLKTDFLKANTKVCATIIDDKGYISNECGHAYRSLVIRGEMELLENEDEKIKGIEILIKHFESNPNRMMEKVRQKTQTLENTIVMRLHIEEISGKERSVVQHK